MKVIAFILAIFFIHACGTTRQPVTSTKARDYFILSPGIKGMEVDPLGHFYVLDESDRLSKYDTTGQLLHHVVNPNLGHIHSLDVGNPFKVLVFYRDQQTVILYDKTLSEIQRIQLTNWMLQDVTAICLSPDNALWVFDGTKKVLLKMDDAGKSMLTSDPFDMIRPPSPRPDFIYDADHYLLLKETGQPIALFNDFGNYLKPIENIGEFFSVTNNALIYSAGNNLTIYNLTGPDKLINIPIDERIIDQRLFYNSKNIYVPDEKGIYIIRNRP